VLAAPIIAFIAFVGWLCTPAEVASAVQRCIRAVTIPSPNVTFFRTTLTLHTREDGAVEAARAWPPLPPDARACVEGALFTRTRLARHDDVVAVAIEVKR